MTVQVVLAADRGRGSFDCVPAAAQFDTEQDSLRLESGRDLDRCGVGRKRL
jgi:hypothetical protein